MPTERFNERLIALLETNPDFVDGTGELLRDRVKNRAWDFDHDLINLLLTDEEIESKFFEEINGRWIFNNNIFVNYINDMNFLDESYTQFRNKIGLNIDNKFLHERGEVALVWPFKDCVLEGDQTREEDKSKEIFFNELLAHDEINRMLDPKVLTNWKRYSVDGEEDLNNIQRDENNTIRENLLIKGNNLIALHCLKQQFRGQVKLIYIDPPYNTGNDSFGYNNNYNHSAWLTFMKNRLEIARELLRDDGSIWINIDDNEGHYLKVLCDEIFGRENFVSNVIWEKKFSPQNDAKWLSDNHDHILVFAKSKEIWPPNLLPRTQKMNKRYKNPDNDPRGLWSSGGLDAKTYSAAYDYTIEVPSGREVDPPKGACWRVSMEKFHELVMDNRIWFGEKGNNVPRIKRFLTEVKQGQTPTSIWFHKEVGHNQEARQETNLVIGSEVFKTPKPERLLNRILHIASNENDIVLDFCAGSGVTAAVAHKMNRQWITIEQMDYVETITMERLKNVVGKKVKVEGNLIGDIDYDTGGISESVNWQSGGDFIYCELMQYNQVFMNKIRFAESSEELLNIWHEMSRESFLNWYVKPKSPAEAEDHFIAIGNMDTQRKMLMDLLDKNQLYVHQSEIDDEKFHVSESDKMLNDKFYKGNEDA